MIITRQASYIGFWRKTKGS